MTGGTVPFGGGTLRAPDGPFVLQSLGAARDAARAPSPDAVAEAIEAAVDAAPPLAGRGSVLVVVSDATRATGSRTVLPALVGALERSGDRRIAFAVASGIHRRPSPEEIGAILGPDLAARHEVHLHDPDDDGALATFGRTRAGTPVRLASFLRSYDHLVLTGAVTFHYFAGFTGGRKAVMPGLAARETVTRNHLLALRPDGSRHAGARAGRLHGNPVHRDMAEGAALTKPSLTVNTVIGSEGRIERVFAGHWRRAHEAACRWVRARRSVAVRPLPLVVASAGGRPFDLDVIQAHKAFEAGFGALEEGGVFVLVAECAEGIGSPDFLPWFRHGGEDRMAAALRAAYQVYGQTALSWRRKASRCRLVLVSSLPPETARVLGARPAADLGEALAIARESIPAGSGGWLLPDGARVLVEPLPAGEPARAA